MTWRSTLSAWFSFLKRAWLIPLVCCLLSCGSSRDSYRHVSMADESYYKNRKIFSDFSLADTLFCLIPCSAFDTTGACLDVSPIHEFIPTQKTSRNNVNGSLRLVPVAVRHGKLQFHGTDSVQGGAAGRAIQESSAVPETQHSYFVWFFVALAGGCLVGLFVCVLFYLKVGR